jgi:hypothetical protein
MKSLIAGRAAPARKLLLSLAAVGAAGSLVGVGAFSAFSGTTTNDANSFNAGTVSVGDNDAGTASLYKETAAVPGMTTQEKCIKITYTGTAPASALELYRGALTATANLDQAVNLEVTSGQFSTGPADGDLSCLNFTPATPAGNVYDGSLAALGGTFAAGVPLNDAETGGDAIWETGKTVAYRFKLSFPSTGTEAGDNAYQGATIADHSFTWEARS